jgi:hypothetical protein
MTAERAFRSAELLAAKCLDAHASKAASGIRAGSAKTLTRARAPEHADLQRFHTLEPVRIRVRDERVTGRRAGGRLRQNGQQKMPICGVFSSGGTGLEPATSGVTGGGGVS